MIKFATSTVSTETKFFINTNSVFHFELFLNIKENHKPNVGDVVTSNVECCIFYLLTSTCGYVKLKRMVQIERMIE